MRVATCGARRAQLLVLLVASAGAASPLAQAAFVRPVARGLDVFMPIPDENPLSLEKVTLGARLFHEPKLSADGRIACATCHDRARAFADDRPVSIGVYGRLGTRNAPTLVNRGYGRAFFWDGRVTTLEEQALGPIENPNELGSTAARAVSVLRADPSYVRAFQESFGSLSAATLAQALASYVRTVASGNAPFDRFIDGERDALSASAQRGLALFRGKGRCSSCHVGPTFTDEAFHNTGVAWTGEAFRDEGRAAITGRATDRGAFKTPTLREVARTAPYMHDGSFATLLEVVEFYSDGGRANPAIDVELHRIEMTAQEKDDLIAFLRSLSGTVTDGSR